MISKEIKQKIVAGIKENLKNYPSQVKMANVLRIDKSQMSRILKGDIEQVLSDSKWVHIARKLNITLKDSDKWNVAKTPVFNFIYTQLKACKEHSIALLLCDSADIGKTFTAKVFTREHKNTVYIDCSQVPTKQRLVRKIASEFGLDSNGRFYEVRQDLIDYLNNFIEKPLIILDEAGDLDDKAFREIKGLWNATEENCGWYMMGADGLKAKIDRRLHLKKVGYTEVFSRFGNKYQKIIPDGKNEREEILMAQVNAVAKANNYNGDIRKLYAKTKGSLRRVKIELKKQKMQANE